MSLHLVTVWDPVLLTPSVRHSKRAERPRVGGEGPKALVAGFGDMLPSHAAADLIPFG